jgi:hypothetical protein
MKKILAASALALLALVPSAATARPKLGRIDIQRCDTRFERTVVERTSHASQGSQEAASHRSASGSGSQQLFAGTHVDSSRGCGSDGVCGAPTKNDGRASRGTSQQLFAGTHVSASRGCGSDGVCGAPTKNDGRAPRGTSQQLFAGTHVDSSRGCGSDGVCGAPTKKDGRASRGTSQQLFAGTHVSASRGCGSDGVCSAVGTTRTPSAKSSRASKRPDSASNGAQPLTPAPTSRPSYQPEKDEVH